MSFIKAKEFSLEWHLSYKHLRSCFLATVVSLAQIGSYKNSKKESNLSFFSFLQSFFPWRPQSGLYGRLQGSYSVECPSCGSAWCFFKIRFKLCTFGRKITEVTLHSSQAILLNDFTPLITDEVHFSHWLSDYSVTCQVLHCDHSFPHCPDCIFCR